MFVIVGSNPKTREIVSAVGPFETQQEAQTFAADHDGQNRYPPRISSRIDPARQNPD
jgi:hypothetical protein